MSCHHYSRGIEKNQEKHGSCVVVTGDRERERKFSVIGQGPAVERVWTRFCILPNRIHWSFIPDVCDKDRSLDGRIAEVGVDERCPLRSPPEMQTRRLSHFHSIVEGLGFRVWGL